MPDFKDIAIFDLDRTLTKGGSFTPFMLHLCREDEPQKFIFFLAVFVQALLYTFKLKSRKALKEYMMRTFMTGMSLNGVTKAAKSFLARLELRDKFFKDGIKAIERHKKNGDLIVIATASMDFYVDPIAKKLGADEIIATQSVFFKGMFEPMIKGENCYGIEKAKRVQAFLAGRKVGQVWFYSDHHTDEPTFELADKKVAVNPTSRLKKIALKNGYDIQHWT